MSNLKPRSHEEREEVMQDHNFECLSKDVVGYCFQVHKKLGSGLLESLYEEPIITYLKVRGLKTGFLINFKDPYFKNAIKRFVL
jgi:hypothetical protein